MEFLKIPPKSATDEQWKTKDGRKIAVCDMTEQHAKNALRLVLRRNRELLAKYKTILDEELLTDFFNDQET